MGFVDHDARREYLQMGLATFLIYFMHAHGTMLAVVFQHNGLPLHDVGLLLAIFGVPVVIVTFLSGRVMAEIGALAAARLGMAVMALGFVSFAFSAGSFWGALVSRCVQGAGYGLVLAPVMTYAQGRLTQERFVYLLALFSTTAPLAQAFGPSWAELLFVRYGTAALFVGGFIPALAALAATLGLRPLERPAVRSGIGFDRALVVRRRLPLLTIFVSGSLFGYLAAYMAPTLIEKGLAVGWFFTASTAALFATRFIGFQAIERLDRRVVIAGGMVVMATGFAVVAMFSSRAAVAGGGAMFGCGYSVVYPLVSAWMSAGLAPSDRSGPQALFNAVFSIGLFGMPYPITLVISAGGYSAALFALAALGLSMAGVLLFDVVRKRPAQPGK
jgi:MFS family permease